jgi:putative heme-binding domain-containing protein
MRYLVPVLMLLAACGPKTELSRYRVPDGFAVEEVAGPEQTGSLVALTFDSLGRPTVAKERRNPVILEDRNGDGRYETEKVFTTAVRNLQGMWWDGRTLYAVGMNEKGEETGVYRCPDADGDDVADSCELVNRYERSMGEHGPHAIRRGPDGEAMVILGNHTGVPTDLVDPNSPLSNYNEAQLLNRYMDARGHAAGILAPGGVLTRWDRKTGKYLLIGGGFRNAYDFAVNPDGDFFTFDSDMEWDINLPWYRGVRSVHVAPGGDYGWRTGSGKLAEYMMDTLPPMRDMGRGSPVGVEFYTSDAYPAEYRGAFFEADWSRGRVLVSKPVRCGGTWCVTQEGKEFIHGEPLNVTDIEVGPDGALWFTTGGRDTEGGLYRVAYKPGVLQQLYAGSRKSEGMLEVVRQPQPLSSWGHAALLRRKAAMGDDAWKNGLWTLALDRTAAADDRVQALLILDRTGPRATAELLRPLAQDARESVRAAAVLVASFHSSPRAKAIVTGGLSDTDPFVRRRALEGMVRMGLNAETHATFAPVGIVYAALSDRDRSVRYAARIALERYPRELWVEMAMKETSPVAAPEAFYALTRTAKSAAELDALFPLELALSKQSGLTVDQQLQALRAFQLTALRREGGAPEAIRKEAHAVYAAQFPATDERLTRELARVLAYCGQPEAIGKLLAAMPKGDENSALQVHLAYCLRDIKSGWTPEQKRTMMNWYPKAAEWRGGASYTGFINMIFDSNLEVFTEDEKKTAWAKAPVFAPLEQQAAARPSGFVPSAAVVRGKGTKSISDQEIIEYQMFDPMTTKANVERGAKVFEKECAQCHRYGSFGKDFGPDLTSIASRFQKKDILDSILYPSKTISDQYSSIIVETKDNDIINAMLVSEDSKKLVLKTAEQDRPIELLKTQVKDRRPSKISIMPEGILNELSQGQIADLLLFLLKGPKS